MIDFKHKTFLEVCRQKNFTKAAEVLCITQPAVSQHIRALEEEYGGTLITFNKRKFALTAKGMSLFSFLSTLHVDCQKATKTIRLETAESTSISFGATLSIGEYVMPRIIKKLLVKQPALQLSMSVDNTKELLAKLDEGKIQFAFIEGFFDKTRYDSCIFSNEPFIGVSKKKYAQEIDLEKLCNERLIIREKGSGTRKVLEQILEEKSQSIEQFHSIIEVGSMSAIKELVTAGCGISFMYKVAALSNLHDGDLFEIPIKGFNHKREFNFVFLKNSYFRDEYLNWFNLCKSLN